jgi:hypothetical protein
VKIGDLVEINGFGLHWGVIGILVEVLEADTPFEQWIFWGTYKRGTKSGSDIFNFSRRQIDKGVYVRSLNCD